MKNTFHFLGALALSAVVAFGAVSCNNTKGEGAQDTAAAASDSLAAKGSIVYIDMTRVMAEYDMANDLRAVVETKVQNIQAEITRRGKKLENEVKTFQEKLDKGLMTRSVAEAQGQKLQEQEIEFNNYAAQKQQEIQEEQVVMMNQLGDAIQTFLDSYNKEKQYAMIITNSGGAPVITADPALDITEDVIAGLNEQYIKTKSAK